MPFISLENRLVNTLFGSPKSSTIIGFPFDPDVASGVASGVGVGVGVACTGTIDCPCSSKYKSATYACVIPSLPS